MNCIKDAQLRTGGVFHMILEYVRSRRCEFKWLILENVATSDRTGRDGLSNADFLLSSVAATQVRAVRVPSEFAYGWSPPFSPQTLHRMSRCRYAGGCRLGWGVSFAYCVQILELFTSQL